MTASEDAAHFTHRHTALKPAEDTADVIDVRSGIKAVATVGAGWLNQPVAALPGTQGHGVDARQSGNFADRKQLLLLKTHFDQRITSLFVHLHSVP